MDRAIPYDNLTAARAGDADAFGAVVSHYGDPLRRYLAVILRDEDKAEDVAQEAFVRAYRSLPALRELDRFPHWLWKIARCAAIDSRRRDSRRSDDAFEEILKEDMDMSFSAPSEFDQWNHYDSILGRVRALLGELPEETRGLVLKRYTEGATYEEIAGAFRLTVGQVKSRLARARARLRQKLIPFVPERKRYRHELP